MICARNQDVAAVLVESSAFRRWAFWSGLVLVWMFTAGFLQFGLLERWALPAAERVNDGLEPTFFAVHINPYYVFSEDFHLYVVRSKRILDRGWTDDLLWSRKGARPNYSAPLQAALMTLAAKTDGRPLPYALFIVSVLTVAWSTLYVAAARWLPKSVSSLTVPIAVLITVLFESVGGLSAPASEYGQWPVHRGLRMATLAWSSPLLLALVLALVSLLFERARPWGRLMFSGIVLLVLALADTWAFLLATACVGVLIALMMCTAILGRGRLADGARPLVIIALALTMVSATTLTLNWVISGSLDGDGLMRAGFGPQWQDSPFSVQGARQFARYARANTILLAILALAAITFVRVRLFGTRRLLHARFACRWPTRWRLYLLTLVGIPVLAGVGTICALGRFGMDHYSEYQFTWRIDFLLLFAATVFISEGAKHCVRYSATILRFQQVEIAASVLLLASLLAYHNVRIYHFASKVAAREFFLTRDEEQLRDWLRSRESSLGRFSLATASHELNYLCAYWTDANLLLPEGFPYHDGATNDELESRTARLLSVFGATAPRWIEFSLNHHPWDQWSWAASRLLSARHGYMYYLLHRGLLIQGNDAERIKSKSPPGTTVHLADTKLNHDENIRTGRFVMHRAGAEAAQRIAAKLRQESQDQRVCPDVIIVDEVSRALGTPDFTGYTREFQHGELEAWVRSDRIARRP